MVQEKQVTKVAAPAGPTPMEPTGDPRSRAWPVAIAVIMIVAFLALLGWVLYPRFVPDVGDLDREGRRGGLELG